MSQQGSSSKHSFSNIKALILVGGYGTRLRPLTFTVPKPIVPFANVPMILHQIRALKKVGCVEVILAVAYQPEKLKRHMDAYEKELGVKLTYTFEQEPLGTAGPLALAKEHLTTSDNSPFFVFNSDITCEYPLQTLLQFHLAHGKEGTIMATRVQDPSKYGVIVADDSGTIQAFVEKPTKFVSDRINAGIYIFSPGILKRIKVEPTSIERQTFPAMAEEKQLKVLDLQGHWMDIGQPKDYIEGIPLFLNFLAKSPEGKAQLEINDPANKGYSIEGNVLLVSNVTIGKGARIGPNVTIAENCKIGEGVRLKNCAIFPNCTIGDHAWINKSIVGWNSVVGSWCRMDNLTVFGENVTLKPELYCNGAVVLPHKSVDKNQPEPAILM